jgi:hypothetical protein
MQKSTILPWELSQKNIIVSNFKAMLFDYHHFLSNIFTEENIQKTTMYLHKNDYESYLLNTEIDIYHDNYIELFVAVNMNDLKMTIYLLEKYLWEDLTNLTRIFFALMGHDDLFHKTVLNNLESNSAIMFLQIHSLTLQSYSQTIIDYIVSQPIEFIVELVNTNYIINFKNMLNILKSINVNNLKFILISQILNITSSLDKVLSVFFNTNLLTPGSIQFICGECGEHVFNTNILEKYYGYYNVVKYSLNNINKNIFLSLYDQNKCDIKFNSVHLQTLLASDNLDIYNLLNKNNAFSEITQDDLNNIMLSNCNKTIKNLFLFPHINKLTYDWNKNDEEIMRNAIINENVELCKLLLENINIDLESELVADTLEFFAEDNIVELVELYKQTTK